MGLKVRVRLLRLKFKFQTFGLSKTSRLLHHAHKETQGHHRHHSAEHQKEEDVEKEQRVNRDSPEAHQDEHQDKHSEEHVQVDVAEGEQHKKQYHLSEFIDGILVFCIT